MSEVTFQEAAPVTIQSVNSPGGAIASLMAKIDLTVDDYADLTLDYDERTVAYVRTDATVSNRGYWLKLGASGAGSWAYMSAANDAAVAAATGAVQPLVDDAEAAAAAVGANALLGQMIASTDVYGPGKTWSSRDDLEGPPKFALDVSDNSKYQCYTGVQTSPTLRVSKAVVSGELQLTTSFAGGQMIGMASSLTPVKNGLMYTGRARFITTIAGTPTSSGMFVGFLPSANSPSNGGAIISIPSASFVGLTYRCIGALASYQRDATTAGSVTYNGSVASWLTEEVSFVFEPTASDGSAGFLSWFVAGTLIDRRAVTGIPANPYLVWGSRTSGSGEVIAYSEISVYGKPLGVTRRIFLDASTALSAASRTGSASAPFKTLDELNRALGVDRRSDIEVALMPGDYRGAIAMDATLRKRVRILGTAAGKARILASKSIPAGSGAFTQIGTSGFWTITNPGYLSNNSTYGGLIDVTSGVTQSFGRTGGYTVTGRKLYNRLAVNVVYTDPLFIDGSYSVHTSGTYVGKVVVRCYGGADPNTRDWEFSQYASGIQVVNSTEAAFNTCDVRIANVETLYSFLYGLYVDRVEFLISGVDCRGVIMGFGYELNHSFGLVLGGVTEGIALDNVHAGASGTASTRKLVTTIIGHRALGSGNFPMGVGDNYSNHRPDEHYWNLIGCEGASAGKDSVSTAGGMKLQNYRGYDAVNGGVVLSAYADILSEKLEIYGGFFENNFIGLEINTSTTAGVTATIECFGRVVLKDNADSNVHLYNNATPRAPVKVYDHCAIVCEGTAPTNGDLRIEAGVLSADPNAYTRYAGRTPLGVSVP